MRSWESPGVREGGGTIAKSTELQEKYKNIGAELVRGVAKNGEAGIGTTTTSVPHSLVPRVAFGANPVEIWRAVRLALDAVLTEFKKDLTWDDP